MKLRSVVSALVVCLGAAACEAPLELGAVEAERAKTVHRFDELQAAAANHDILTIVGMRGVVLTSADDGISFTRAKLAAPKGELPPSLIDVAACPDGALVALDVARRIWRREAGEANSWAARPLPTEEDVLALACDPAGRLWVVGSFALILTSDDGGATWNDLSLGEDVMLSTVLFVDGANGFITGEFGTVLRTGDGGATWEMAPVLPNEFFPQTAVFETVRDGWVAGLNGIILRTTDGGESWVREPTPTRSPIYSLVSHGGTVFAAGNYGTLLRRGPESWEPVSATPVTFGFLRALLPLADDRLLVGGSGLLKVVSLPDDADQTTSVALVRGEKS